MSDTGNASAMSALAGTVEHHGQRTGSSVPRVPDVFVPRGRLVESVESGVGRGMVIVSAPAGSGKTLLLASWSAQRSTAPAWLSVEPEDADPARFWARVLSSLQSAPGLPPGSPLSTLRVPPTFDDRFVGVLLAACDEVPGTRVLVLDEMHQLTGTPALESLARAMRRGLGSLHLVVSTRSDPALPLQRLRLSNELTEIRTVDLAFDETEAVLLLDRHGVHLQPDQLEVVLDKTEGWAAGLRLAALSLQDRADLDQAVQELAGELRTVADYFAEEVLGRQPEVLTEFLLDTCVVRRVSADLANALTGRADGQRMLDRLDRDNLFVVALDERRAWYRYHRLFGDLLRHRLTVEEPERQRTLHKRAASWFARHGEVLEAARHLTAAEDWHGLGRFVLRAAGAQVLGVERNALVELLRQVPAEAVVDDPELAATAALAGYAEHDAAGVHANAARARDLLGALPDRDAEITDAVLTTVEALAAWAEDDAEGQIASAARALQKLDRITAAEVPALGAYRFGAAIVLATGKLWTGQLDEAEAMLTRMTGALSEGTATSPGLGVHLHGSLGLLAAFRGRIREAERQVGTAMSVAEQSGWLFLSQSATAFLAQALGHLVRSEPELCSVALVRGRACVGASRDRIPETGFALVLAQLELSRGHVAAARAALGALRQDLRGWSVPWLLERWAAVVDAEVAAAEGEPAPVGVARDVAAAVGAGVAGAQRAVLAARYDLAANRSRECLEIVGALTVSLVVDLEPATDAWLLTALAHQQLGNDADALAALGRALDIAAPEGIARPFVRAGSRLRVLLERHEQTHSDHRAYAAAMLEKVGRHTAREGTAQLLEPLTNRERSVLVLLPAMLSNAEIASELFVSVNTVKVHLKSLYRKLGVKNRRQAVSAARELGLLGDVEPTDPVTRAG